MAKFFFNLCEDGDWTRDLDGQQLSGLALVRRVAIQRARSIIAEDQKTGVKVKWNSFVTAVDEHGEEVCRITFADLLKIR